MPLLRKRTETRRNNNPLTSAHHRLHGFTQIFILWDNNIYICVICGEKNDNYETGLETRNDDLSAAGCTSQLRKRGKRI